ncbi:hypothetical protein [Parerythrobacter lacustris]|uniref:Lipoprotein n=1 Tax=Parerythrobacter lacustris TaxID=2969984 RepID=A0ABT1XRQ6_9SPHN|nr:hypothetical protein [Parerythrobacter lacustris]MCR2833355.1 hypothetical protein [Parerythrobacter lacustris]
MRLGHLAALLMLPLLTACPALPGPRIVAPVVATFDPACIKPSLEGVAGVDWVIDTPSDGVLVRWQYGSGEPPISKPPTGPWASLNWQREPGGQIAHSIPNHRYLSEADYAASEVLMHRAVEALGRECGLPPTAAYSPG